MSSSAFALIGDTFQARIDTLVGGERSHHCAIPSPLVIISDLTIFFFRFQTMLPEIFGNLSSSFKAINARMKAENFRVSLLKLFLLVGVPALF